MYQSVVSRLNDLFHVFLFFNCMQLFSLVKYNSFKGALN